MRLGLSSFIYRWSIGRPYYQPACPMTLEGFIDKAVQYEMDGVMLCNNFTLEEYSHERLRAARRRLEEQGMFIETGARGASGEYFSKMLNVSHILGSRILRMVVDVERSHPRQDIRSQLVAAIEMLKPVVDEARRLGIRLALENYAKVRTEELIYILDTINDPVVRACLDTANSASALEPPLETTRLLAPYAVAAHFKDFIIEMNPRGNIIQGTALGNGMVDFSGILEILRSRRFAGNVTLELYIDRLETPEETAAWEEDCVAESVRYAREKLNLGSRRISRVPLGDLPAAEKIEALVKEIMKVIHSTQK